MWGDSQVDKLKVKKIVVLLPLVWVFCTVWIADERSAHAGYFSDIYNNIQEFKELPDQINELKESYSKALQDLDRAKMDAELYQKQNADLAEQNRQLTEMVEQLQEAEAARAQNASRLKTIAITAVALLAGYFILTRALRFGMRRTN